MLDNEIKYFYNVSNNMIILMLLNIADVAQG